MIVKCDSCGAKNRVRQDAAVERQPICGKCGAVLPAPSMEPAIVTDANYADLVEASSTPVLLDLWAAWCGPCRIVAPMVDELATELAGRVRVAKLNVDENPATAGRFNVVSIPTLLVLKEGREIDRIVGVQPKAEIVRRLARV